MRKFAPNRPDKCRLTSFFTARKARKTQYTMLHMILLRECRDRREQLLVGRVIDRIFGDGHSGICKGNGDPRVAGADIKSKNGFG